MTPSERERVRALVDARRREIEVGEDPIKHGLTAYTRGKCRCGKCRAAHADRARRYAARQRAKASA